MGLLRLGAAVPGVLPTATKQSLDAPETSPDVAAFVRRISHETYEHAVIARKVDRLEVPGEY